MVPFYMLSTHCMQRSSLTALCPTSPAIAGGGVTSSLSSVTPNGAILAVSMPHRSLATAIEAKKGNDSSKTRAPHKADLPTKVCVTCGRPFTWRKKWEKVWDDVKYCSDRCRSNRSAPPTPTPS